MDRKVMTDDQLIGYADIHCETPRALFSAEHIRRMYELAFGEPYSGPLPDGFYRVKEMKDWVARARRRRNIKLVVDNTHDCSNNMG